MLAAAKEQWKEKAVNVLDILKEDKKLCYTEAPYRSKKTGEVYAGFENAHSLSARNRNRPTVFDRFGTKITDERIIKSVIYSGCYVHAKVKLWPQDNKWGAVNCTLLGVMFAQDGEAFGGSAPATAEDFKDPAAAQEDTLV